jgi:hypothetical protein
VSACLRAYVWVWVCDCMRLNTTMCIFLLVYVRVSVCVCSVESVLFLCVFGGGGYMHVYEEEDARGERRGAVVFLCA